MGVYPQGNKYQEGVSTHSKLTLDQIMMHQLVAPLCSERKSACSAQPKDCRLQVLEGVEPNEHGTWQVGRAY